MSQRKSWTTQEDLFITQKVRLNQKLPDKQRLKWGDIADELNLKFPDCNRSGKQCRQRWHNQLDPNISKNQWTAEEQRKLFELQKKLGNKWAVIASQLKGRTDNNVKNYFYSTLRKSLRKLNSFISLNRTELKNAKQFKQSSLSKLLAVADHKFDKKINVKKSSAQEEAIQIKNLLIQVTGHDITNLSSKNLFNDLVKKLQQWNKCCKKKKGKRKLQQQEMDAIQQQVNSQQQEENQNQSQNDNQEEVQIPKTNNKRTVNPRQTKRQVQGRSRSRNKTNLNKKRSDVSRKSAKENQNKTKTKKQQTKTKLETKPSKLQKRPSIPEVTRRVSSRHQQNSPNHQNFIDLARSSLDLGKYQRKNSFGDGSQLFKSFVVNQNQDDHHHNQKKPGFTSRVSRANSNMSFFNMIKEVSLINNESKNQDIHDFLQEEGDFDPFYMNMLRKQSSKRQIPLLRDQSNFWNVNGLDQSLKFQPQISKLRSYKKQSANFELQYKFADDK